MKRKRNHFSLSGSIAIIHLSAVLLLEVYRKSFAGSDGMTHWTDENWHILKFITIAEWGLISPFGIVVQGNANASETHVWFFVFVLAINSAFIGLVLEWIIRRLFLRFFDNTPQHPTQHDPQHSAARRNRLNTSGQISQSQ